MSIVKIGKSSVAKQVFEFGAKDFGESVLNESNSLYIQNGLDEPLCIIVAARDLVAFSRGSGNVWVLSDLAVDLVWLQSDRDDTGQDKPRDHCHTSYGAWLEGEGEHAPHVTLSTFFVLQPNDKYALRLRGHAHSQRESREATHRVELRVAAAGKRVVDNPDAW